MQKIDYIYRSLCVSHTAKREAPQRAFANLRAVHKARIMHNALSPQRATRRISAVPQRTPYAGMPMRAADYGLVK